MTRSVAWRSSSYALVFAAAVLCGGCDDSGPGGGGVELRIDRVLLNAPLGRDAKVCVSMASHGNAVAGTQNDLLWDGECLMLVGPCAVNPATGKQLMTSMRGNGLRAILLSLTDVDPVPDGELYCCTFRTVTFLSGDECCPIQVSETHASDPAGNALPASGITGEVCAEGAEGAISVGGKGESWS
jgi:hypothetical protein